MWAEHGILPEKWIRIDKTIATTYYKAELLSSSSALFYPRPPTAASLRTENKETVVVDKGELCAVKRRIEICMHPLTNRHTRQEVEEKVGDFFGEA